MKKRINSTNGSESTWCLSNDIRSVGAIGCSTHVLRFWESKFSVLKPLKRSGGRRYYRTEDIQLLKSIKSLLYDEGYTIKGSKFTKKAIQRLDLSRRTRRNSPHQQCDNLWQKPIFTKRMFAGKANKIVKSCWDSLIAS